MTERYAYTFFTVGFVVALLALAFPGAFKSTEHRMRAFAQSDKSKTSTPQAVFTPTVLLQDGNTTLGILEDEENVFDITAQCRINLGEILSSKFDAGIFIGELLWQDEHCTGIPWQRFPPAADIGTCRALPDGSFARNSGPVVEVVAKSARGIGVDAPCITLTEPVSVFAVALEPATPDSKLISWLLASNGIPDAGTDLKFVIDTRLRSATKTQRNQIP